MGKHELCVGVSADSSCEDRSFVRGYCASVVGNLAVVQGGREALLGHALILPALIEP